MRQIVLDTETTGLESAKGHQIIEIGCIELIDRRESSQYHQYLKPTCKIDSGAYEVHGIDSDFLADKPAFADIVEEFIGFIKDSELIIHAASFDVGFLNAELNRLTSDWGEIETYCRVVDSLALAKQRHPGQKNSLDALCNRYNIDNSKRDFHGALIDAKLLTLIYLKMTSGQTDLMLQDDQDDRPDGRQHFRSAHKKLHRTKFDLPVIRPSVEEREAHRRRLETLDEVKRRALS